jgi:hypothetical protein
MARTGGESRQAVPDGPDDHDWSGYRNQQRERYSATAYVHRDTAMSMLASDRAAAEKEARAALDQIVRAFWWSEGLSEEETVHEELHALGRWVRQAFGCRILPTEGTYQQRCPVAIAHKRFGFSVGFVARRICSICGEDLSECPHMPGTAYLVPGGVGPVGHCAVCHDSDCNEHDPEKTYRVPVIAIVKEAVLEEVSIVERPAQPEARLTAIPLSTAELKEHLGPEFEGVFEVNRG